MVEPVYDRALGCLLGVAAGDALGMPASFMTPGQIRRRYGRIERFIVPDAPEQTAHGGLPAGSVTDDTQETALLAECMIHNRGFERGDFLSRLRAWAVENHMLESTVTGPSTRRLLSALVENRDPGESAALGDTNGSAMRVAPVGIFHHGDVDAAIRDALASSAVSHASKPAMAGAAAVAAAVALCVTGRYSIEEIMDAAIRGAVAGEAEGGEIVGPSTLARIVLARRIVDENPALSLPMMTEELVKIFGNGMKACESVPFSLGVFYASRGSVRDGILAAVNAGDDADTNGAITGALCGAYEGARAFPDEWRGIAGADGLDRLAGALLCHAQGNNVIL